MLTITLSGARCTGKTTTALDIADKYGKKLFITPYQSSVPYFKNILKNDKIEVETIKHATFVHFHKYNDFDRWIAAFECVIIDEAQAIDTGNLSMWLRLLSACPNIECVILTLIP